MSQEAGMQPNYRYHQAIDETREYLEINGNPEATDDDAFEHLAAECGQQRDGSCTMAGSEYCDFECPFS